MKRKSFVSVLIALILSVQVLGVSSFAAKTESTESKTTTSTDKKTDTKKTTSAKDEDSSAKKTASDNTAKGTTEEKKTEFPKPRAKSAIVIDANSGDAIYSMEASKKLAPAGVSNIMTAIIALENGSLSDRITITSDALKNVTYDQPQLGIKEGESYTLEQLLYAILLNSDNDAANAIAIGISGSIKDFVIKMNEKAEGLGLSNTHFENPTGMHNQNHYTTAEDLATLARYAMKNSDFREIVKTPKYTYPASGDSKENTILSTNHLVSRYKYPYHFYTGTTGVKSGNSTDAGYCLVASAEKNNLSLITVVMGCDNTDANEGAISFVDTKKMLDYVFENYQSVLLTKKGDVVFDSKVSESKNSTRVALTVEDDVYITLKKGIDSDIITNEVNVVQDLKAPIKQGDYFGTITYYYNGKQIKTANIVAANEVKRDFILHIFGTIFHIIFNPFVLILLIAIIAIYTRSRIVRNRKRRLRRQRLLSQNGGKKPADSNITLERTSKSKASSATHTSRPTTHRHSGQSSFNSRSSSSNHRFDKYEK